MRRRARTGPSRRAGLTLIEVVISAAIVSLLALVVMSANIPLSKTANEAGVAFDLDRAAGRFFTQLRREVRQSGYNDTTPLFSVSGTTLTFRMRTSLGDVVNDTTTSNWSREIQYSLVASPLGSYPTGAPRYRLQRAQAGLSSVALDHVQSLTLTLFQEPGSPDFDATLHADLVLARTNPNWTGRPSDAARLIVRQYSESIEFLNKPQQ